VDVQPGCCEHQQGARHHELDIVRVGSHRERRASLHCHLTARFVGPDRYDLLECAGTSLL
jgi:hypothetical protein